MSYGVGRKRGLDPVLLWPAAMALIRPLAWEPPYAASVAVKSKKKKGYLFREPHYLPVCSKILFCV